MSTSVFTWSGKHFGYRKGDALFTRHGVEVGHMDGDVVYANDGVYLGELKSGKLVTDQSRAIPRKRSWSARQSEIQMNSVSTLAPVLPYGYEDFPDPDEFQ